MLTIQLIHAEGGVGVGNGGVLPPPPPGYKWREQSVDYTKLRFSYNDIKVNEDLKDERCEEIYSLAKSFYYKIVSLELVGSSIPFSKAGWLSFLKPQIGLVNAEKWVQFLNNDWGSLCKNEEVNISEVFTNDKKISSVILIDQKNKRLIIDDKHWSSLRGEGTQLKVKSELYLSLHLYLGLIRLWSSSDDQSRSTPFLLLEKLGG